MHGHQLDVPAVSRERTPGAGHPICFGTEQDLAAACTKLHAAAGPARAGKAGERRGGPPAAGTAPGRRRADVVQRLYSNEVSRQRRRDVKERWEKEEMQECTFTPKITRLVMAGVAGQVGSKADVSERLYAHGREREEALREAREQHLAREARLLQEKSVVSGPKSVPAWSVFERSRKWRSQVDRRIAERKEGAAQQEEKELQESSVHKRLNERLTGSAAAAKREEAVDRLYRIDLKKRKARADERIRSRQMDIEKEFQEQEMRSVHARAAARGRAGRRAAPLAGRGPGGEDEEVDEARRELVLALFDALGRGRERLGPPELRRLSGLCGFCGGDAAWGAQYEQLADIYGFEARQGLSAEHFGALVGDADGRLHCTEDDLHFLLTLLGDRAEMAMQLFGALDTNSSGVLGSWEMRKYARLTGFNGDAKAWATARAGLYAACGWDEAEDVDPWKFFQMVDDEDGEGHLADADLLLLLTRLQSRPVLVARLFRALDSSGSGRLAAEEFVRFAAARRRGFDGGGGTKPREQYKALSLAHGWDSEAGVGAKDFARMVSDAGSLAHCTTGELREALAALGCRTELIVSAFGSLDDSDSGRLPCASLRRYAEFCGFEGHAAEWEEEYRDLAASHGWDARFGADLRGFASMVNDRSGNGYCSTEELLQFVVRGR